MSTLVLLVQVLLFVAFVSSLVFFISFAVVKYRMERTAKQLECANVDPSGSTLTHGMVRRDNSRGVVSDSKPSLRWFTSLLR